MCQKRKRAPKPRRERAKVVTDGVRAAMLEECLRQRLPVQEVLTRAVLERGALYARIRQLDQVVCARAAWRRVRRHEAAAVAVAGLPLCQSDSVWQDVAQPAVRKLAAIGAGNDWRPCVSHARPDAATAKAARTEMASLMERMLALLALEFRLREDLPSPTARVALPPELQSGALAVTHDAVPCDTVPAHVAAYARARNGDAVHEATFAAAIARAVTRAIHEAFFGCLALVSSTGTAVTDADLEAPRPRAALAVINGMLSIAARCHSLVAHDCDEEDVVPIVVYHRDAKTFAMPDLEGVVAHSWPAARALADVAAASERWVRDARKTPRITDDDAAQPPLQWWVGIGTGGLAINHAAKAATLAHLEGVGRASEWWPEWPPARDDVLAREARVRTAIAWGGKATAAFLGVAQPDQYVGRPPFGG